MFPVVEVTLIMKVSNLLKYLLPCLEIFYTDNGDNFWMFKVIK